MDEFKITILSYSRKINDHLTSSLNKIGAPFGLTGMQVILLMKLFKDGTNTIGNLAADIRIAGANISTLCKKLEQKGLLTRKRDLIDERVVKISLTVEGLTVIREIDALFENKVRTVLTGEKEETLETIINGLKILDRLLDHIEKGE